MAKGGMDINEGPQGLERRKLWAFSFEKKKGVGELPSIMSYHRSLESGMSLKSPCLKKLELRKVF